MNKKIILKASLKTVHTVIYMALGLPACKLTRSYIVARHFASSKTILPLILPYTAFQGAVKNLLKATFRTYNALSTGFL